MKLYETCSACGGRGAFGTLQPAPDGVCSYRDCAMCEGCGFDVHRPLDRELMRHLRAFLKAEAK